MIEQGPSQPHQVDADAVDLNMDQHANGLSTKLFKLGKFLRYAAPGTATAGAALAAYVTFIASQP